MSEEEKVTKLRVILNFVKKHFWKVVFILGIGVLFFSSYSFQSKWFSCNKSTPTLPQRGK